MEVIDIIQSLALRLNTRRSYSSLMRTYFKLTKELRIFTVSIPSEFELCRLMVAYLRGHKFTTLSNFISATKKHFEHEGILPRGVLFRNVRNGLSQMFSTIDATVHEVALRRKDLLTLIAHFVQHELQ